LDSSLPFACFTASDARVWNPFCLWSFAPLVWSAAISVGFLIVADRKDCLAARHVFDRLLVA
jgi:hypothetical protein